MIQQFYDELASSYHFLFSDWQASVSRQAKILNDIIQYDWGPGIREIADVSCGIGTQTIGLAQQGYHLKASDISLGAIKRAEQEAYKMGLKIPFIQADMRDLSCYQPSTLDLIISCDNSIPHLLTDGDILKAFRSFYECLKPGGGCLITVRDYAKEQQTGIQFKPYAVHFHAQKKYLLFQTWEFDGSHYLLNLYITCDSGTEIPETQVFRTRYHAVSITTLIHLFEQVGFESVDQRESDFYQPVIVASKPF